MLARSIVRIIEKILLGSQKYSQTYGLKLSTPGTPHQISGRLIVDDLPLLHSIFFGKNSLQKTTHDYEYVLALDCYC
jgi:hypothetical protein